MADRDAGPGGRLNKDLLQGLLLVCVAMVLLPIQDSMAKLLSGTLPVGEINWIRFIMQAALTLPFLLRAHGRAGLVPNRLWPNILRGALVAVSSGLMFFGLKYIPLADALAIFFVSPLVLTILSAFFGGEHIGWPRRIAVIIGFAGALIVIRPSYAVFGLVAILPLACAIIFAIYVFLTRRYVAYDSPLTMQLTAGLASIGVTSLAVIVGTAAGWPPFTPVMPDGREILLLLVMGLAGTGGQFLVVKASRHVPGSLFAPFQYLAIVTATGLGFLIFGDFPDPLKWLGIAIIVGSGLYVFWRESRTR